MHPDLQITEMELRRRDLLRQARLNQLMAEAKRDTPAIGRRLIIILSDLMISGGTRLKQHAGQTMPLYDPTAARMEVINRT